MTPTGYTIARKDGRQEFYPSAWKPSDGGPPPWTWTKLYEGDFVDLSRMPAPEGRHAIITDAHVEYNGGFGFQTHVEGRDIESE